MNQEKILEFFKTKSKGNFLWILGLVGILLIGLSALFGEGEDQTPKSEGLVYTDTKVYAKSLEEQLEEIVSNIKNAGACKVMVTLEQGAEYVYATEEKNTADTSQTSEESRQITGNKVSDEETYIIVSTKQGDQPLLLTEIAPRVKGVVVVCEGGSNPQVVATVTNALATALNISENRVCVVAKS
jgi:stage III sporulation protein AG